MCPAKVTVSCKAQEPHRGRSFLPWSWTMCNDLRRQKLMCVETWFTYIHRNIWCWAHLETTINSSTLGKGTLFSIVYWSYPQWTWYWAVRHHYLVVFLSISARRRTLTEAIALPSGQWDFSHSEHGYHLVCQDMRLH